MIRGPKFSVIIPVFNGEKTIARALESVLDQTYPPHEIIVIDDGSEDRTEDTVNRFSKNVHYFKQTNQGVSVSRNNGARIATGNWLTFLDADDYYYPDRLETHADYLIAFPKLGFLTSDFDYRDPSGKLIKRSMTNNAAGQALLERADQKDRAIIEQHEMEDFVSQHFGDTHTLSVRRSDFIQLGGYPSRFAVCEDVHFLIRLCAQVDSIGVICRPLAAYIIHANSATRSNPLRAQRQTVEAFSSLIDESENYPKAIQIGLRGALRHARLDHATVLLKQGSHLRALCAIIPELRQSPGYRSLRDVLSIAKG